MELNADFSQRVLVHSHDLPWTPSPMAGVDRRPLDRIGDEVARATSIVRYAPDSHFSEHTHHGGEEFIVLDGVFQDNYGDFPADTYVRNPVGTSHTPRSKPGTVIFVKLWQFDPDDKKQMRIDMMGAPRAADQNRPGVQVAPLFSNHEETVAMEIWEPYTRARWDADGGAELLMLEGEAEESGAALFVGSWLRVPDGEVIDFAAGAHGARFWIKTGHLRHIRKPE